MISRNGDRPIPAVAERRISRFEAGDPGRMSLGDVAVPLREPAPALDIVQLEVGKEVSVQGHPERDPLARVLKTPVEDGLPGLTL
jgi:hypothetical protein